MERETGLEPATSSLGSHTYIGSKSLARFCCELLNLQRLLESAFSKTVIPNEARIRQIDDACIEDRAGVCTRVRTADKSRRSQMAVYVIQPFARGMGRLCCEFLNPEAPYRCASFGSRVPGMSEGRQKSTDQRYLVLPFPSEGSPV